MLNNIQKSDQSVWVTGRGTSSSLIFPSPNAGEFRCLRASTRALPLDPANFWKSLIKTFIMWEWWKQAAPIFADRSGFILFSHKHGDSKGIQSLWQGFGDSVPITNPSETQLKKMYPLRGCYLEWGKMPVCLQTWGFPSSSHLPEPVCRGVSMPAGIDKGAAPWPRKLLKKFDQNFYIVGVMKTSRSR